MKVRDDRFWVLGMGVGFLVVVALGYGTMTDIQSKQTCAKQCAPKVSFRKSGHCYCGTKPEGE